MEGSSDSALYRDFLTAFCKTHKAEFKEGACLPFRLCVGSFTSAETEGECIDWLREFLQAEKCPDGLVAALARNATDAVLSQDLSGLLEPEPELKKEETGEIDNRELEACHDKKDPPERRLISSKVLRIATAKLYETCHEWNKRLPDHLRHNHQVDYCAHAIKNGRRKMEDRHVTVPDLHLLFDIQDITSPKQAFFAVFDGHGGTDAATYSSAHLLRNVVRHESFPHDPEKAFEKGFINTDEGFLQRAALENLNCGSTGVCALIREDKGYVAWLGDSQAVLVRNGKAVTIMDPHKPERPDEKERIENLGGCVVWFGAWRVNGNLSVSRAIGDRQQKPYVSNMPDIVEFDLDGTEDYLVLACDGLWDVMNGEQMVAYVEEFLRENDNNRSQVAQALVRHARDSGSTDNISAIVVYFNHPQKGDKAASVEENSEKVSSQDKGTSEDMSSKQSESEKEGFSEKDKKNESNFGSSKGSPAPPSEMLSSKGSPAPPSEMLSSKGSSAPPSEMLSSKGSPAPPSEMLSSKGSSAPPSEMLSSKGSSAPPSEMFSSKGSSAPPSERLSSKGSMAPISELHSSRGSPGQSSKLLSSKGSLGHSGQLHSSRGSMQLCTSRGSRDHSSQLHSSKGSAERSSQQQSSGSEPLDLAFLAKYISKSDSNKPIKSNSQDESASTNPSKSESVNQSQSESINQSKSGSTNRSKSSNGMRLGDINSDTSVHSDMGLMTKAGKTCMNNRKAKRSKNGRNGRAKDNKRAFRGRLGGNLLTTYGSSKVPPRSRSAESNLSLAQKNMLRSGDQIFELLTGCSPDVIRKVKCMGKWTVAVEMENAAAMFESELETPTTETRGRRQSDITHSYFKK